MERQECPDAGILSKNKVLDKLSGSLQHLWKAMDRWHFGSSCRWVLTHNIICPISSTDAAWPAEVLQHFVFFCTGTNGFVFQFIGLNWTSINFWTHELVANANLLELVGEVASDPPVLMVWSVREKYQKLLWINQCELHNHCVTLDVWLKFQGW